MLTKLEKELALCGSELGAQNARRFFKTGIGQYGYGDQFMGITIPVLRQFSKQYKDLSFSDLEQLLTSPIHEKRMLALLILVLNFKKAALPMQNKIYNFYITHLKYINNWDLVDGSTPYIIGPLASLDQLDIWVKDSSLWVRRIAILATFHPIRQGRFSETLHISEQLLHDTEDLIHKAVGWMLREVGKRNLTTERKFLDQYAPIMPRTMLRYAIEKFDDEVRRYYLQK